MLRVLMSACVLFLSVAAAEAASFCHLEGGGLLQDGSTITQNLKIVVASYPRPQIPGYEADKSWCSLDRRALGGYIFSEVTEAPKLGKVAVYSYKIRYRGDKVGHDHFVLKHHWLGIRNEKYAGTIVVDVEIVAEPF